MRAFYYLELMLILYYHKTNTKPQPKKEKKPRHSTQRNIFKHQKMNIRIQWELKYSYS